MAPETLAEAERLILAGDDLDAVAEAVGVTRRTLERAFRRKHGRTPGQWRIAQRPPAEDAAHVTFRLAPDLRRELAAAARADGFGDNAWAKAAVVRVLAERAERLGKAR